ncbi:Ovochymase-2 [Nymphon striatum]|nr:Ovochymase-2 [Nymphon striatum]
MSQVKLECLDNLLRGRRAAITKRIDLINSAVEKGDNAEIEIQCQLLKEAGIKLEAVSEDILSIISEERFDSEIEKQEQYRENIARCFFTVESRKQKAPEGPLGDKKAPLSHNVQVKLPKLFIDPFDGDVLKWTTFFEQFKSSIHENNHLSPIDKFNYLKSLLRGAAANSIMGLPLTASNYNAAIELLQSRFGKPSVIIQGHITRLLNLSLLKSADDITAFRRLLDELQINVRGLDGLGINGTTYSVILIPILVSRLPDSVRFEWAKRENSENATVEQFLEFLNREVELREKASHSINFRVENNKSVTNKVFKSTVSTLYSSSNQLKCPVCSAFHRVVQCTEFLNSDDKEKVIKRLNLCFNCLSPGHRVSQCPSKYTCKICKLKHHSLIHRYKEGSSNANRAYNNVANISQMSSSSTDNTSSLNADAVLFKPSEPNSAALIAHSNSSNLQNSIHSEQFLLQTAKILVKGEKGHLIANLMFDSASNRSYVRKGLVKQLSCPVMRHEHINCAVFGGKPSKLELKNVRSVCVADRYLHRHHDLELLEVDTICASLQRSAISLKLPHLEGLTLADTFDSSSVIIDILIGMDYYWSLLGSEIVTGPSGPVAQNSVFGYVLSGPTLNSGSSPTFTTLSPNRWKTFICNRVTEIQQHTEPSVWRYCPGEYNPADLLTREFVCDISNNMLWWGGPKWLSEEQKGWPCSTFKTEEVPPDEINVCLNVTSNPIKPILDITKFNNYQKMLRVTAYLFRAISIMQKQPTASKQISTEELNYVEFYWYRTLQQEFFYSEYCALRDGSSVNSKSKLKDLHPIWDSSLKLMRLGGRLQYSDLPYSSIHPIIVPHKSYFAKLLILDCHRSHSHCGVSQLICIIRERLWLSRLRSLAKSVVRVCVICRRVNQRACHEIAAPLPSCRINPSPPFNVVGIDFCGPLLLKGSRLKHYVCLFTCATTRAIHLELVDSLKTEEFLLCFRRFIGRRNVPSIIISDNAATFVKASHDSFITSKLLCEVESIINHRPLTYVSEDSEAPCALTPASFLTGASTLSFRDYSAMIDSSAEQLRIRKKHCDKVLDHIWSRWKKEYLLSLPTCVSTFSEGECLKIGAVVLIREDNVPRSCWKLGRVLELIRGRDDRVRAAVLKTSSGTYNRPIQRLHVPEGQIMYDYLLNVVGIKYAVYTSSGGSPCGGMILHPSYQEQLIQSPNYPSNYPINVKCRWVIIVPSNETVKIDFKDFDIAQSSKCKEDYVLLRYHEEYMYNSAKLCGSSRQLYHVSRRSIQVIFNSNSANTAKGFSLGYVFISKYLYFNYSVSLIFFLSNN